MADGAAISLPIQSARNEDVLGLQLARVRVNSGDTTAVQYDIRLDSDDSDAAVEIFNVPGGTFVMDMGWSIHTAFTAANTFTLGDTDDADGWAAAAVIASTTIMTNIEWASKEPIKALVVAATDSDAAHVSDSDLVPPFHAGKLYMGAADTDTIELSVTTGGTPAVGQASFFALFFQGWGRPVDLGAHDTVLFA